MVIEIVVGDGGGRSCYWGDLLFRGIDLDDGLIIDRNVVVVGGWWAWVVVGSGRQWVGSGRQLDVGGLFPRVSEYYSITVIKYKMMGAGNR